MLLTLQALFVIPSIQFRQRLNEMDGWQEKKTNLLAAKEKIENSMNVLFETMHDNSIPANIFKNKIGEVNAELKRVNRELSAINIEELENAGDQLYRINRNEEKIFLTKKRLDNDIYTRLLWETVKGITVYSDKLTITLTDGNEFSIPRILIKYKVKDHLRSDVACYLQDDGSIKYTINFYCSRRSSIYATELVDTSKYNIMLYK